MKSRWLTTVLVSAVAMAACSSKKAAGPGAGAGEFAGSSEEDPGPVDMAGSNGLPPSEITPASSADPRDIGVDTDAMAPSLASPVNVIITADNAYGFGYGTASSMVNYFGGVENDGSPQIFGCQQGPEKYTVPSTDANVGNYLYIVSYADKNTTQGVIAQFFREGGLPVYTGSGQWEVCGTGLDFDLGSRGPTLQRRTDRPRDHQRGVANVRRFT